MGAMEEDPLEVGHQAVDVHQQEALEVAVGVLQWEVRAVDVLHRVAQEVDVHQLEVLEVDRQVEVGLEMVLEVQVSKELSILVSQSVSQLVNGKNTK